MPNIPLTLESLASALTNLKEAHHDRDQIAIQRNNIKETQHRLNMTKQEVCNHKLSPKSSGLSKYYPHS